MKKSIYKKLLVSFALAATFFFGANSTTANAEEVVEETSTHYIEVVALNNFTGTNTIHQQARLWTAATGATFHNFGSNGWVQPINNARFIANGSTNVNTRRWQGTIAGGASYWTNRSGWMNDSAFQRW